MDVFRFKNPTHPTLLDQGELINGLKSKMWIERYRDAGDFEFLANLETMAHKLLPIGTLISHVDSTEVMVVENHEIKEDRGKETEVKITGRSFESFLENRIVGSNKAWPTEASGDEEYIIPANVTWVQAVVLLRQHIDINNVIDPNDALLNVRTITDIFIPGDYDPDFDSNAIERSIGRGSLYSKLLDLMEVDNLGIKTVRPGVRSPLGITSPDLSIVIHQGEDLSQDVAFSYATGEIQSSDYFWSNRTFKNSALVVGRWLETIVKDASSGYDRRMMIVDGSFIDSDFSTVPIGSDRDIVLDIMEVVGQNTLASQRETALVKTEPTRNSTTYKYREHYNIGDIITIEGEYQEPTIRRISEYVEIEDETGESGYPTLSTY